MLHHGAEAWSSDVTKEPAASGVSTANTLAGHGMGDATRHGGAFDPLERRGDQALETTEGLLVAVIDDGGMCCRIRGR